MPTFKADYEKIRYYAPEAFSGQILEDGTYITHGLDIDISDHEADNIISLMRKYNIDEKLTNEIVWYYDKARKAASIANNSENIDEIVGSIGIDTMKLAVKDYQKLRLLKKVNKNDSIIKLPTKIKFEYFDNETLDISSDEVIQYLLMVIYRATNDPNRIEYSENIQDKSISSVINHNLFNTWEQILRLSERSSNNKEKYKSVYYRERVYLAGRIFSFLKAYCSITNYKIYRFGAGLMYKAGTLFPCQLKNTGMTFEDFPKEFEQNFKDWVKSKINSDIYYLKK